MRRVSLFTLPCLFMLFALPGTAAARPLHLRLPPEACPIRHILLNVTYQCSAEFSLRASNGYRITVSGEPGRGSKNEIELSVERGGEGATYYAPGTLTPTSMKASFGNLGEVSLHFRPSSKVRRVKIPKRCLKKRPPLVTARLGTFVGTIRFRGEGGYTKLSAHRAVGGLGDPLAITPKKLTCQKPVTKAQAERELGEVALSASARGEGIVFQASGLPVQFLGSKIAGMPMPGQDRYLFLVIAAEKAEGMSILRSAGSVGPAADFVFDNALTAATLTPPAPFTGTASFQRAADGSTTWTGNLSAPLPGLGAVNLTEPRFKGELATLATLSHQGEEASKPQ